MEESHIPSRRTWPLVALLLAIALAMRIWQVTTTEVASRDSIGYVRIAWRLEHNDWREILPNAQHHPGYPVTILAASYLVRAVHPGPLPDVMQYSAQLASSIASVLLVVPMFYLGRELFDRRVAFWATLLFQCLPASGRILADGLSEPLFFLFVATALWLAAVAFNRRSVWCYAGVGVFGALAYLTRPEGAVIVAATGVVLVALQLWGTTRRPWLHFQASVLALVVGALVLAGPFMYTTGRITTKITALNLIQQLFSSNSDTTPVATTAALEPAPFAVWYDNNPGDTSLADQRRGWALLAVFDVLGRVYFYALWLPMLLGVWLYRDRFRLYAGIWVMTIICVAMLPVLYSVAMKMGYLSDRHTLLILFCTVYCTTGALLWLGERGASYLRPQRWASPALGAALMVGLVCTGCLVRTLEPMHGDRVGYREAGYYLANHAQADEFIDDPYTWTSYYAGRDFVEKPTEYTPGITKQMYVVIEWSKNKPQTHWPTKRPMEEVMKNGKLIKKWPVRRSRENAEIVLYKMTF